VRVNPWKPTTASVTSPKYEIARARAAKTSANINVHLLRTLIFSSCIAVLPTLPISAQYGSLATTRKPRSLLL